MQLEQSERLADVVASALECARNERAQFLSDVCGDNVALRLEAESFLRFEKSVRDFLEVPAWEIAPLETPPPPEKAASDEQVTIESIVQPETSDSTPPQQDTASTQTPDEGRSFFEVPPLSITEGELPIVTENWADSGRLIESAIEFTTPTELKASPVEPIEDFCPTPDLPEPPVLETTDETAFEESPAGTSPTEETQAVATARVEEPEERLIDSAIEFTTPTELKASPVAPIEDFYPTPNLPEPPVLEATGETAFEESPAATSPTEETPAVAKARVEERQKIVMPPDLPIQHHEIASTPIREEVKHDGESRPKVEREQRVPVAAFGVYAAARILAIALLLVAVGALVRARFKAENLQRTREVAETERAQADKLTNFLQRTFSLSGENVTSVWPVPQRNEMTVAEMLDQIAPRIDKEFRDRPALHAGMLRMIGSAYASQGKYDAAEKNLRAAFGAQVRLHGEENAETAATMVELGILSARELKYDDAERYLGRAIRFYRGQRTANAPGNNPAKLAIALAYLGQTKFGRGSTTAGISEMREALEISSAAELQGADKSVFAFSKGRLGSAFIVLGETEQGEPLLREAIAEYRRQSPDPRWEVGELVMMLGVAALNRDQPNEAEKYLAESEQILRQTLGGKNIYLVTNLDYQASALAVQGDFKPAEEKARECLALCQEISPQNKLPWAGPLRTLGNILTVAGQAKEGEDYYREALGICERQATRNFSLIVPLKIQLCHLLLAQRRLTEAENLAFEAQTEAQRHFDEQDPVRKAAASNLIQIYRKQGKDAAAQTIR